MKTSKTIQTDGSHGVDVDTYDVLTILLTGENDGTVYTVLMSIFMTC